MAIKVGDEASFKGRVAEIDGRANAVVTLGDTNEGFTFRVPLKFVELADQRVTVPECVKNDLDEAITSELDSLDVARVYLNDGMMFSLDTKLWIDKHRTAFMHALVDGYKVETTKKYYVKVPSTGDFYYWKPYLNNRAVLSISNNKDSSYDEKQFTMDEIKEYGLENFERVEVQDG